MPIYVYRCDSCGENTEVLQKVNDAPLSVCPHCQAQDQMRKVIAPVGVIFKGSGFHKNDYTGTGGGAKKSGGDSSSATTSANDGGGEKKSDSGGGDSSKAESSSSTPSSTSSPPDSGGSGKVA